MPILHLPARTLTIDGLILDKDGTLHRFDTYWLPLVEARLEAVAAHCPSAVAPTAIAALRRQFGIRTDRTVDHEGLLAQGTRREALTVATVWLYDRGLSWSAAGAAAEAAFAAADDRLPPTERLVPIANLREWLSDWVQAGGKLAVASTASRRDVDAALTGLGLDELIPHRLGGDEVQQGKPHPEMVERLAVEMGLEASRLGVIGDGVNDLRMGRTAGVGACIGVTSGVDTAETLSPWADLVVDQLSDLRLVDVSS